MLLTTNRLLRTAALLALAPVPRAVTLSCAMFLSTVAGLLGAQQPALSLAVAACKPAHAQILLLPTAELCALARLLNSTLALSRLRADVLCVRVVATLKRAYIL